MQVHLTIVNPGAPTQPAGPTASGSPSVADVIIDAPAGATLADIDQQLLAAVGRATGTLIHRATPLSKSAMVGHPPLVDGAVVTVDLAAPPEQRALLELHVAAGPDAGGVHYLGPGEHIIGRGSEAEIRLNDLDVSRVHAAVHVANGALEVHDLASTNGTMVAATRVTGSGASLGLGQVLKVGASCLQVRLPQRVSAIIRPDGEGHLAVNRPPRLFPIEPRPTIRLPAPPAARQPTRFPLIAAALPALAGVALVAFTGSASYLFFVLLSPLMVIGTYVSDRLSGRRGLRDQRRRYDEELSSVRACMDALIEEQSAARHSDVADAASLLLVAAGPQPSLWERRPADKDFLHVRLGLGDLRADVEVSGPAVDGGENLAPEDGLLRPVLKQVPIDLDLQAAGVTGIAGPRALVLATARFLVAQVAGWHSPRHVRVAILVGDDTAVDDWRWVRWLPHLRPEVGRHCDLLVGLRSAQVTARVAELTSILEQRLDHRHQQPVGFQWQSLVVVLDGVHTLRRLPGVARLLAEGPAVSIYFLCLDPDPAGLPVECGSTVVMAHDRTCRIRVAAGSESAQVATLDGVSLQWAQRFARHLAPLRDATPDHADAALPASARLLDLLTYDPRDPAAIKATWGEDSHGTSFLLGVGADGSGFHVDLVEDGPHLLVAGTTGSGKSELLQTVVAGLALSNRPDEMSFVLIDYKGGAAFKDCARLPHTVGMVTDLDGHLPERALASLGAELRRRETVLRAASAKDLDDYRRSADADPALVPRLVLVVDEFATLAEELPEFLSGLVAIAQRGRSLGVHLILATQRPGGVVSADIRANVGLRIALRVTDAAESCDVIDTAAAAIISRATPGRALARFGAGTIMSFQCARVGGHAAPAVASAQVRTACWRDAGDAPPAKSAAPSVGATDLEHVVDAIRTAAADIAARPVATPWLPPLDAIVTAADLPPTPASAIAFGLIDVPSEQRRAPLLLDLAHGGHLLVAGTARTGRTTLLRTLAGSLAAKYRVDEVHIYALDGGGGGLSPLAELPQCGVVAGREDPERADRVLSLLAGEVQRRQILLTRQGFASLAEQAATTTAGERMPWLVVLIDGWEAIQALFDEIDHGRPLETLMQVLREGSAVGLRAVITGDRSVLTGRLAAAVTDRLVLRLADPADYALAGITARQVPAAPPAGRALLAPDGLHAHVALLDKDPAGAKQIRALQDIAQRANERTDSSSLAAFQRPIMVRPLPLHVSRAEAAAFKRPAGTDQLWTPIGVGGDDASVQGVALGGEVPAFVIIGPSGSGRSTALLTMTFGLSEQHVPLIVMCGARSPLRRALDAPDVIACLAVDEAAELGALIDQCAGPLAVVVDDVEMLHERPAESHLLRLLHGRGHSANEAPRALVVAGSTTALASQFRGLTVEARRSGCGLLLGEIGPMEADLLGIRPPPRRASPPGRALLVVRGRTTRVQIAVDS